MKKKLFPILMILVVGLSVVVAACSGADWTMRISALMEENAVVEQSPADDVTPPTDNTPTEPETPPADDTATEPTTPPPVVNGCTKHHVQDNCATPPTGSYCATHHAQDNCNATAAPPAGNYCATHKKSDNCRTSSGHHSEGRHH